MIHLFDKDALLKEVYYKAVRSGGKGGQNVNKVATKVELYFDVTSSVALSEEQKELLLTKNASRISEEGLIKLTCDTERSQYANKERVAEKILLLIQKALTPKKKRIAVTVSKTLKEKRLQSKKKVSEKKERRKKDFEM